LAKLAVSGSVMAPLASSRSGSWSPVLRGQLFDDLVSSIETISKAACSEGQGFEISAVILVQGEGDTWGDTASSNYGANLELFLDRLGELAPAASFIICALSAHAGPARGSRRAAAWEAVRRQQHSLASRHPRARLVDPDILDSRPGHMFLADGIHYSPYTGFARKLGRALAEAARPDARDPTLGL
jgi:hypothetical protein